MVIEHHGWVGGFMFCGKCGEENQPDNKFCTHCGALLQDGTSTESAAPLKPNKKDTGSLRSKIQQLSVTKRVLLLFVTILAFGIILPREKDEPSNAVTSEEYSGNEYIEEYTCLKHVILIRHRDDKKAIKVDDEQWHVAAQSTDNVNLEVVFSTPKWIFRDQAQSKGALIERMTNKSYECQWLDNA
ncbi:zinc-ribbon domain-containing protein [Marinobacterium weihaiense]|uniref:Zinc-ribbon domain-containing protein n=1 Tax=Marinobacterium weihaiense TaxID=2851016 RepID=A0ABS6MF34_9GAMM|nr:zinc ribbon domain-containing protein [Marinobacterium weihaiense]MBV0934904.1 zinc-ribbon domain-containing protein [Marinobacterium weihaiense]